MNCKHDWFPIADIKTLEIIAKGCRNCGQKEYFGGTR